MITHTRRTHLGRQEFLQAAAEHLQQEWREGHHIKSCPVFFGEAGEDRTVDIQNTCNFPVVVNRDHDL